MEKKVTPFVGQSTFAKEMSTLVQTLAGNNASVLLVGEKGTGRRLIAQHIHSAAGKSSDAGYFFEINCRSFTEAQVIESFETVNRMVSYGQKVTLFVSFADILTRIAQTAFLDLLKKQAEKNIWFIFL